LFLFFSYELLPGFFSYELLPGFSHMRVSRFESQNQPENDLPRLLSNEKYDSWASGGFIE